jgi:hypothetical protein
VSGVPADTGTITFTARVEDEVGAFGERQFLIEVGIFYVCGDANGDAAVNVGDAVYIINFVFKGGDAPNPIESGDANCDGQTNVGDAVYLINFVFKGGPNPCCP